MVRGGGSWTRHEGVIELSQVATARGPTSQRDDMLASLNSIVARLPRSKGTLETTLLGRRRLFSYSEVYEDIIRVRRYLFDRGLGPAFENAPRNGGTP